MAHVGTVRNRLWRKGLRVGAFHKTATIDHVRWLEANLPKGADGKPAMTITEYLVALLNDAMAEEEA